MQVITMYQAEDGEQFTREDECLQHEMLCRYTEEANKLFQDGCSLAHAIDHRNLARKYLPYMLSAEDCAALNAITKDTKLIISHWQCREEAGYKPIRLELDGKVFVHGHAGSWSGPYGNTVTISDLIRYYRDTIKDAEARKARALKSATQPA